MGRVFSYLAVFSMIYSFYVVFTGATSAFSLVLGVIASAVASVVVKPVLISRDLRVSDAIRLFYLVAYYFYYMLVAEVKAHIGIARIVLSRKIKISPAIVEVPYYVGTSYGMTLIAGSITNTPGTVVVQVDTKRKVFFVHWLTATTYEPVKAREEISAEFERYAQKIFG
ncbi:MAG: Na+/H+ antiporter subunit E [Sulfolobales archaeon]